MIMTAEQTRQPESPVIGAPLGDGMSVAQAVCSDGNRLAVTSDLGLRIRASVVELTLSDLIHDPMIAIINRADGISSDTFAQLLMSAARLEEMRGR
jgi:hypothetical protein